MFVDSHCHLDLLDHSSASDAVTRAHAAGVNTLLCIGVELGTLPRLLETIAPFDQVYASVGVHPEYTCTEAVTSERLQALANSSARIVGIGETGLDFHDDSVPPRDEQITRFCAHIDAAQHTQLPLIIHTRQANEDTLAVLKQHGQGTRGVFHCFTENMATARAALDLGFHISLSGIITFRSASALREVAAFIPQDRLLIETDSPWLAPVPYRGKPNEPAYVVEVAKLLADIRHTSLEHIARTTSENFFRLFDKIKNG